MMNKLFASAVMAALLLTGCGPSDPPASPSAVEETKPQDMGLTKDQIIAGVEEWLPSLESAPLDNGMNRLMGKFDTAKAATLIEFVGADANRPSKVSLMMIMPSDAPSILLGNLAVYGAVTKNLLPGWTGDDRMEWMASSVKSLSKAKPDEDGGPQKITKEVDGKRLTLSVVQSLGMVVVTIENPDHPR